MTWLKMRYSLENDIRVHNAARKLGIETDALLGKLFRFWAWVSVFSRDGYLPDATPAVIDLMFGCRGFAHELHCLNWLKTAKKGQQVVNWDDHLSTSAKQAAAASIGLTVDPAPLFPNDPPPAVARAKKRQPAKAAAGFEEFWAVWPYKSGKADAVNAWNDLSPTPELLALIIRAVMDQRTWPRWIKDNGEYIPLPATWLRGCRWNDMPAVAAKADLEHAAEEKRRTEAAKAREEARQKELERSQKTVIPGFTPEQKAKAMPPGKPDPTIDEREECQEIPGFYEAYLQESE